jgi:hypothetical protein
LATPEDKVTHFNGRRASGVALLVIASLGCAWHVTKTREASDVVAWRLVGLPSVGGSYVVGDNYRLQPQKSNLPRWNFDTSVNYALAQSGARYFEGESLKLLQRYPELVQWSQTTLREVLLELLARRRGVAGQVRLGSLENRRFPGDSRRGVACSTRTTSCSRAFRRATTPTERSSARARRPASTGR